MNPLGPAGLPLALLYEAALRGYRWSYESGWRKRERFSLPVLSVGNISAGGSGKSPLVTALCRRILERGKRPAVVSRGYGRQHPGRNLFVSRGKGLLIPPGLSGDETALLARKLPVVPIVVTRNRAEGIRMVADSGDIVLLDDGFQSLEVLPEASLVFLPPMLPDRLPGHGDLLPAGPLREHPRVLGRATHWILSGSPEEFPAKAERVRSHLARILPPEAFRPILGQRFVLSGILDGMGARIAEPASLRGARVALVLGIANPDRVIDQVAALGGVLQGVLVFPDHVPYDSLTRTRIHDFARHMEGKGATILLTTEKDQIKWTSPPTDALPIRVLEGEAELYDLPEARGGGGWTRLLDSLLGGERDG